MPVSYWCHSSNNSEMKGAESDFSRLYSGGNYESCIFMPHASIYHTLIGQLLNNVALSGIYKDTEQCLPRKMFIPPLQHLRKMRWGWGHHLWLNTQGYDNISVAKESASISLLQITKVFKAPASLWAHASSGSPQHQLSTRSHAYHFCHIPRCSWVRLGLSWSPSTERWQRIWVSYLIPLPSYLSLLRQGLL